MSTPQWGKYTKQELVVHLFNTISIANKKDTATYRDYNKAFEVMATLILSDSFPDEFYMSDMNLFGGHIAIIKKKE